MWAAGKVEFLGALAVGAVIERRSRVLSITEKQGATGPLIFVEVAHETFGGSAIAVREAQTLVYRDAPPLGSPAFWPAHRFCGRRNAHASADFSNLAISAAARDKCVRHRTLQSPR